MFKHIWKSRGTQRHERGSRSVAGRSRRKILLEVLESRQLLTASLGAISNVTAPALLGYQVSLDGSGTSDPSQTFTATSSNPDIKVSVARAVLDPDGQSYRGEQQRRHDQLNEQMTFQLFNDLTPTTVSRIETLTNGSEGNYYTTGSPIKSGGCRRPVHSANHLGVVSGFAAIQGGSDSATSTSSSSGVTPSARKFRPGWPSPAVPDRDGQHRLCE